MHTLIMVVLLLASITSAQAEELIFDRLFKNPSPTIEVAATCILEREYRTGPNKFCVSDCMGSKTTITISTDEIYPINLDQ